MIIRNEHNDDWTHVGFEADNGITFYKYVEGEGYYVQMLATNRWRLMPDANIEVPGFIRSRADIEALTQGPYVSLSKVSKELKAERARTAEMASGIEVAEHSRKLHEQVLKGEREYQFDCDEGKTFFIRPRVVYDVCTDDEDHVTDCVSLKEAQRYCKQLNIEDRMGNGRVDFGGETPQDLTGFVEANKQMIRNVLTLSDDVLAYLATLPDEESQ